MRILATGRNRPARTALAAVAVVVLLGGCGADDDGAAPSGGDQNAAATPTAAVEPAPEPTSAEPSTAPAVDPCALVTKQEAEKVAGTRLEDAVASPESCSYTGPVTGPTAQLEVYVGPGAKKILDIDRELKHEFTPIAGAGDEAYAEDGAVFVNKGGVWVAIRLVRLDDPALFRKPLADLAKTVAGRL
ncbi:DUF3558 family protein [Micromonospora krabiensis]|uniref:DUF3558 domain-containing protein n=1 Tax=Micromonospora krabiensis TaxID=307121 RepID=A0A1C3N0C0_9ACTN|nr:DUF3558 family protein [Micromonospora krabiensis]SBV26028.1 Protein of unknown function [Micromonospora krabiensis]